MATIVDPMEAAQEEASQSQNPNQGAVPEFGGGSVVADARATGTGPGPKAATPSASGSFKDFSKFQEANKGKVAGLSKSVTDDANKAFTEGSANVGSAVTGARSTVTGQQKDASQFNNLTFNDLPGKVQDVNDFRNTQFDAEGAARQAAENIGKSAADYTKGVTPIAGATNVAGVRDLVASRDPKLSSVATGGDALLLRSNQAAREGLQGAQKLIKGYDVNAVTQQGLQDVNTDIQNTIAANTAADEQLKTTLDKVRQQGEGELNQAVARSQDKVYQQAIAKILEEAGKYGQNFKDVGPFQETQAYRDKVANATGNGAIWIPGVSGPVEYEKESYQNRFFNNLTEEQIAESAGGQGKLRELLGIPNSVKGANVLAEDARLRAGFEALNNLGLGSKLYNPQAVKASEIKGAGLGSTGFNALRDILTEASKGEAATKAGSKAANEERRAINASRPINTSTPIWV
jgi:hypothetical protein